MSWDREKMKIVMKEILERNQYDWDSSKIELMTYQDTVTRRFERKEMDTVPYCFMLERVRSDSISAKKRRKTPSQKESANAKKVRAMLKKRFDSRILALDILVEPLGKKLRDCTGAECSVVGGIFEKFAEMVKPNQIVGDVLTDDEAKDIITGQ